MITLVLSAIHIHTHVHAGLGREMIVVVDDITGPAPCVGGDALSEREGGWKLNQSVERLEIINLLPGNGS